jgi:hypothetical protein
MWLFKIPHSAAAAGAQQDNIFPVGCNGCTCNETKLYHSAVEG